MIDIHIGRSAIDRKQPLTGIELTALCADRKQREDLHGLTTDPKTGKAKVLELGPKASSTDLKTSVAENSTLNPPDFPSHLFDDNNYFI